MCKSFTQKYKIDSKPKSFIIILKFWALVQKYFLEIFLLAIHFAMKFHNIWISAPNKPHQISIASAHCRICAIWAMVEMAIVDIGRRPISRLISAQIHRQRPAIVVVPLHNGEAIGQQFVGDGLKVQLMLLSVQLQNQCPKAARFVGVGNYPRIELLMFWD